MNKIPDNQIVIYQKNSGAINIEATYFEENIWLSQKKISELFEVSVPTINEHLTNIFYSGELEKSSVIRKFRITAIDSKKYLTNHYSLEAIISIGYRVNTTRGTEFRQWATGILKSYIQKGYALDDQRMKYGSRFSTRYFDELYEEIKDIRTSERMIYQKITDIYATSIDYSPRSQITKDFFATVQNKLHFAITGQTAAEIITGRVNSTKPYMGLTSWRRSPRGKIMPSDIGIAKNYLSSKELTFLNHIGNMYLDFAELQAARGRAMRMEDWIHKLDAFLKFNERDLLTDHGRISHEIALALAETEYDKYRIIQDQNYISDFDRAIKKVTSPKSV